MEQELDLVGVVAEVVEQALEQQARLLPVRVVHAVHTPVSLLERLRHPDLEQVGHDGRVLGQPQLISLHQRVEDENGLVLQLK